MFAGFIFSSYLCGVNLNIANMSTVNVNIDDFYRNEVESLSIEAKKQLAALLNASLAMHDKLSKKKFLLNKVSGAWKDGESAEDTIARIASSRRNRTPQSDF